MKKIFVYLSIVPGLLLASCEDYLDLQPEDVIESNHYWETANASALEQYCNTFYPKLIIGQGNPNTDGAIEFISKDCQSDNIYSTGANTIAWGQNLVSTSDSQWSWSIIRGCNELLDNYMKSPAVESAKNQCAGEIYFFKAMDYFNKVMRFGDVPWYTHPLDTDSPELYKGRDSRYIVMDSILMCLDKAIELMPKKSDVTRVSKDAALALKARVCLFEGTWRLYRDLEGSEKFLREAYNAAGELMKPEYGYSLYNTGEKPYYNLFIQDNYIGNSEVILSKEYDASINMGHDISRGLPLSNYGMSRDCFEEYLCARTGLPISLCSCHKNKSSSIEMRQRDPRLLQTICNPADGDDCYYLWKTVNGKRVGGAPNIFSYMQGTDDRPYYGTSTTGYCIAKYYNPDEYVDLRFQGSVDSPIFRYAEILLIRAEAGAELGEDPELDKTINLLRQRAGLTFMLSATPPAEGEDPDMIEKYPIIKGPNAWLIREIRRERRVELFGEGLRYMDILRWHAGDLLNRPKRGAKSNMYTAQELSYLDGKVPIKDGFIMPYDLRVDYKPNFTEKNYLFNIPLNETSLNPNLLPQNPGWE